MFEHSVLPMTEFSVPSPAVPRGIASALSPRRSHVLARTARQCARLEYRAPLFVCAGTVRDLALGTNVEVLLRFYRIGSTRDTGRNVLPGGQDVVRDLGAIAGP
jgi:hypothetical protein